MLTQLIHTHGLPSVVLCARWPRDRWSRLPWLHAATKHHVTINNLGITPLDEACENLCCLVAVFLLFFYLSEPLCQLINLICLTIYTSLPETLLLS